MNPILEKYARLLVEYCLDIQPGDRLLVRTTTLAEPLVREVFRQTIRRGGNMALDVQFEGQNAIFMQEAEGDQLTFVSPLYREAMEHFEAYLYIMAPFNLREDQEVNSTKVNLRQEALSGLQKIYSQRTASRSLKRNLCLYPTSASAQNASMSIDDYQHFVYKACKLFDQDPVTAWLQVRSHQQSIADHLNSCSEFHYKGPYADLTFSTKGRTWINSDGQTNMPSGEIYTSPVENSVNGTIEFSYPGVYMGHEVERVRLWVKDGYIEKWEAARGKEFLDRIFSMKGTRRFGEAAIGTNYDITRTTRNILFDEKIGGSVHLAIGQSYIQAGGKNESPVHWDMITDMTNGGEILANGEKIYENGYFLIS